MPYVGVVFYIWVGIFSLATIAQFWSYANDIYRREAGERLFPFIFLGATLGAPVGALLAGRLFEAGVSPYDMMHLTTLLLLVHLAPLPARRPAGIQAPEPGGAPPPRRSRPRRAASGSSSRAPTCACWPCSSCC